jgi:hypothetical protein
MMCRMALVGVEKECAGGWVRRGVGKLSSSQGYISRGVSIRDGQNPCGQTRLVRRASAVLGLVGGLWSRETRACGSRRWSLEFGRREADSAEVCRKFGTLGIRIPGTSL